MGKYIIGAAIVALLGIMGFSLMRSGGVKAVQQEPEKQPFVAATSTYATSSLGISVVYPKEYRLDESYAYDQFGPKKLIHGVKFIIPETMATGTNLSADSGVSVEQLPRAVHCTGDIYLKANVRATSLTLNGIDYSLASSSEAAAGNIYEEWIYALSGSKPCTALRYFIHSSNIANYPTGTVREFDRSALTKDFDSIRDTLKLAQ